MKKLGLLLVLLPILGYSQVDVDQFIYPNPSEKLILIESLAQNSRQLTGRQLSDKDPRFQLITAEMNLSYHQQINRVNQCIRNLTGNHEGPNILLLSGNEGGFPRQGIRLVSETGDTTDYPDLHFADLVLDPARIERGDLAIYSHEMGHVFMSLVMSDYWDHVDSQTSPKQHVSMGITDYLTAFYEGWGVQFQRLTYDAESRYRQAFHNVFQLSRGISSAWHSNLDEILRIQDVENLQYIYEKQLPAGINPDTLSIEDQILFEHTSTLFDPTRIKNAQQLLSSEGVLAALFYQLNRSKTLQNNYREAAFYHPFLIRIPDKGFNPAEVFSPLENILLKSAWIWKKMEAISQPGIPAIDYLQTWCTEFPEDRAEVVKIFIYVTRGRTVSNDLAKLSEQINYYGQVGDYMKFRELSARWGELYQSTVELVLRDPQKMSANIGPEVWVEHPEVRIRRALWMPEPKAPLAINLNTAGFYELKAFYPPDVVQDLMANRRAKGYIDAMDLEPIR